MMRYLSILCLTLISLLSFLPNSLPVSQVKAQADLPPCPYQFWISSVLPYDLNEHGAPKHLKATGVFYAADQIGVGLQDGSELTLINWSSNFLNLSVSPAFEAMPDGVYKLVVLLQSNEGGAEPVCENVQELTFTVCTNQNSGITGPAGPSGERGATGEMGLIGPTGAAGQDGQNGATGPTGIGIQGATGNTGPMGPMGPPGLPGRNGTNGAVGATGATGATGQSGINGKDGRDGKNASAITMIMFSTGPYSLSLTTSNGNPTSAAYLGTSVSWDDATYVTVSNFMATSFSITLPYDYTGFRFVGTIITNGPVSISSGKSGGYRLEFWKATGGTTNFVKQAWEYIFTLPNSSPSAVTLNADVAPAFDLNKGEHIVFRLVPWSSSTLSLTYSIAFTGAIALSQS